MFQNLNVIQKMEAEKVQWAQHFIDRGFQGWWKFIFSTIHPDTTSLDCLLQHYSSAPFSSSSRAHSEANSREVLCR